MCQRRTIVRQAFIGSAIAALLASCSASETRAASGPASATGDPAGLALLARVHRAYSHVPGVGVSGQAGALSFRFTLVLDSGIVVAEQFVGRQPSSVTMLVARRGGPTYAREPGTSCWRPQRSSGSQ